MCDLNNLLRICMAELDSINLVDYNKHITSITVNNRLSRALGRCIRSGGSFRIELAGKTAADNVNIDFIKNVIMHELVHTIPGCWNHGPLFQSYARRINAKLGYHVSTTETAENMQAAGVQPIVKKEVARFALVCGKCGKTVAYRQRKCALMENLGNYTHTGCGGDLYVISLDPKIALASFH